MEIRWPAAHFAQSKPSRPPPPNPNSFLLLPSQSKPAAVAPVALAGARPGPATGPRPVMFLSPFLFSADSPPAALLPAHRRDRWRRHGCAIAAPTEALCLSFLAEHRAAAALGGTGGGCAA